MKLGEAGEAYNICHDEETRSIASIAHLVATHVSDDKSKVIFDIPERCARARLCSDSSHVLKL